MTTASPARMDNNAGFVKEFVSLMSESLGSDAVSNKRKDRIDDLKPPSAEQNALNVRFALGGDDSLYLQAGVTLLYVQDEKKFELAPARLYSSDVLEATKQGLMAAKNVENAKRREESDDELKALFRAFYDYAVLFLPYPEGNGLNYNSAYTEAETAVRDAREEIGFQSGPKKADAINKSYDKNKNTSKNAMKQLIKFFYDGVNPDTKETEMIKKIMEDVYFQPTSTASAPTSLGVADYAMFSGICDYVSPHETQDGCSGVDAMVDYSAPADIEQSLKLSKMFASSSSHEAIRAFASETAETHMKAPKIGELALIEATLALDGKHTLLDHEDAKGTRHKTALRWEPTGEHGDDFASAAVLGHIIGRVKQVAQNDRSLSVPAKNLLMHTAAVLKLRQLDNMRAVQDAVRMGTAPALSTGTPLPPPPVISPSSTTPTQRGDDTNTVREYIKVLVYRGMYYAFIPDDADLKAQFDRALPSGGAEDRLSGYELLPSNRPFCTFLPHPCPSLHFLPSSISTGGTRRFWHNSNNRR